MGRSKASLSPQKKMLYAIFCALLFTVCLLVVAKIWNGSEFYVDAYRPSVERAAEYERQKEEAGNSDNGAEPERGEESESEQPAPYGFRERDIDKAEGDRYRAF